MKFKIILSILFVIVTAFSAMHQVNHIDNQDTVDCEMCIVNKNLTSSDIVDDFKDIEILKFEIISQNNSIENFYNKQLTNQNRAPPKIS